jgi:hypothetical protein
MLRGSHRIPILLKLIYSLFVIATIWIYLPYYGPRNFLWFSDIALILTAAALWLESAMLASMMAVGVLVPEIGWTIAFFSRLAGRPLGGVDAYVFDTAIPFGVRAVSLFHLILPPLLVWMVYRLGYDRRALLVQTLVCWIVYPATYWLTDAARNINWAFGPGKIQHALPAGAYLLIVMVAIPSLVYWPTHLALRRMFGQAPSASPSVSGTG